MTYCNQLCIDIVLRTYLTDENEFWIVYADAVDGTEWFIDEFSWCDYSNYCNQNLNCTAVEFSQQSNYIFVST